MKKLYLLLASALLFASSASAAVSLPYESGNLTTSPGESVNEDAWTKKHAGTEIATTWAPFSSANALRIFQVASNPKNIDDWLVSPGFVATKGNTYKVEYYAWLHTDNNSLEHFDVHFTQVSPISDASAAAASPKVSVESFRTGSAPVDPLVAEFTAAADGLTYVAFRAHGQLAGGIYVTRVSISDLGNLGGGGDEGGEGDGEGEGEEGEHECAGLQTPYASSISVGSQFDEGWVTINHNGDNKEWYATRNASFKSGYCAQIDYTSSSGLDHDDFLISPAIHLEKGVEYKVLYGFMTGNYEERMRLYASESADPDDIVKGTVLDFKEGKFTSREQCTPSFTPAKTGDYYFSFHAISDKDEYYMYVGDFQVVENVFAPEGVSALKAVVAPDRELKITLSWALPTKSVLGDAFTAEQTVEKVEIYRDGGEAPIATLGAVEEFEDTADTGLTSGKHTYSVVVTVAGIASSAVSVGPTAYAGPIAPTPVPAEFSLETQDDFDMFTREKGENSTTTDGWYFNYTVASLNVNYGWVGDDWLITPPIAVAEPGYYRVTFNGWINNPQIYSIEGCVGTSTDISEMKVCATEFTLKNGYANDATNQYFDFYAETAGTYYAALHVNDPKRESGQAYNVRSFKIDFSKKMPAAVKNLTVGAEGASCDLVISWNYPETTFSGEALSAEEYELDVIIDGEVVATVDGGTSEYTYTVESGVHTVSVVAHITGDAEAAAPTQPTFKTGWIGSKLVSIPYTFDEDNKDTLEIWEILDANADNFTWYYGAYDNFQYPSSPTPQAFDDYLLSPYFDLAPGAYKVKYGISGGSPYGTNVSYIIGFAKAGAFTADNKELYVSETRTVGSYGETEFEYLVNIEEGGEYQFVFGNEMSASGMYSSIYPYFYSLHIEKLLVVPALATEVTVTPAADMVNEATISWLNPSENILGGELAADEIVKAVIYRDGEEIGEVTEGLVPGETSSYVDTEVSAGVHTYMVEIYNADGKSEEPATEVKSPWIGGGLDASDYVAQGAEAFGMWEIENLNSANTYNGIWQISSGNLYLYMGSSTTPNTWAVSPKLQIEENCIYKVSVESRNASSSNDAYPVALHVGADNGDYSTMPLIGNLSIEGSSYNTEDFYVMGVSANEAEALAEGAEEEGDGDENDLEAKSIKIPAGISVIGLYANTKGYNEIYIKTISTHLEEKIDTGVENVTAANGVSYSDGKLCFEGMASVSVYDLAGALVAAEAKAVDGYDLSMLQGGVYIVRVAPEHGKAVTLKIVK